MISRFDEGALGPNLVAYYNPNEVPPDVTGTDINFQDPAYAGVGPQLTQKDVTDRVIYDPVDSIGAAGLKCWSAPMGEMALVGPLSVSWESYSIVMVMENVSGTNGDTPWSLGNGGSMFMRLRSHWDGYPMYSQERGGTHRGLNIPHNKDVPASYLMTRNLTDETYYHTVRDSVSGETTGSRVEPNGTHTLDEFLLFGSRNSTQGFSGKIALFALYDRELTATEQVDLLDLCDHWVANGEAPGAGTAPTITTQPDPLTVTTPDGGSFIAAADGDPAPDLQWQASADGATGWGNADVVLTSTVTGTTTGTLSVTASNEADNGYYVRMRASNTAGTADTNTALYTVNPIPVTSTDFGPVTISDTDAVLTWQWSGDNGTTWQTATEVMSDVTVETGPGGDNNLAEGESMLHVNTGQVSDTGQIRCLATTIYNSDGVPTEVQNLVVEAQA